MGSTPGTEACLAQRIPLVADAEHDKESLRCFAIIDAGSGECSPCCRGPQPGEAQCSAAQLSPVLDRRLRIREGSASGVPWGTASGQAVLEGWERQFWSWAVTVMTRGTPRLRIAEQRFTALIATITA